MRKGRCNKGGYLFPNRDSLHQESEYYDRIKNSGGDNPPVVAPMIQVFDDGTTLISNNSIYTFPTVAINEPAQFNIDIINNGTGDGNLTGFNFTSSDTLSDLNYTIPSTLGFGGASTSSNFEYDTSSIGLKTATFELTSDDPVNPTYTITFEIQVIP